MARGRSRSHHQSCCPRAPARVLDVPCGDGRIALPLERAGYDVTGVDISSAQDPRFVQGDLRALPDLGAFDAVLSWGNSFGYTTPPETQQRAARLQGGAEAGGRLILESLTVAEAFLRRPSASRPATRSAASRWPRPTPTTRSRAGWRASGASPTQDGHEEHASGAHHVHTTGEVVRMLEAAGFTEHRAQGPDGAAPYALGDHRMIAVAV